MSDEERDAWDPAVASDYNPDAPESAEPEPEGGVNPEDVPPPEDAPPGGGTEAPE